MYFPFIIICSCQRFCYACYLFRSSEQNEQKCSFTHFWLILLMTLLILLTMLLIYSWRCSLYSFVLILHYAWGQSSEYAWGWDAMDAFAPQHAYSELWPHAYSAWPLISHTDSTRPLTSCIFCVFYNGHRYMPTPVSLAYYVVHFYLFWLIFAFFYLFLFISTHFGSFLFISKKWYIELCPFDP